ncbi:hypothetical protein TraAM80_04289 [Trypanosoma rangeli]|uniref:Uncharacterized protein n=1 Tax=Trypanosoma rangeli TaxID=5698 RepID=A0A422NKF7_TRYRA|nr:uncharacterized protein TraAM80_04289 [Trypanosoma rangeli]RNF05953.1 hypothetical protein TraAM80_04289 [Trypanosoma rangeli]|eukprot:RNF05953.1 hypothetical protein TraAM80_04289 [Trypanosoma rangeli]
MVLLQPLTCLCLLVQLLLLSEFAAATGPNAFTVVVLDDEAAETLRKAPEGAFLQISPYFVQLSSNWTVVERNVMNRKTLEEEGNGGQLLHCRLPLPHTAATVDLLEKDYAKRHQEKMRMAVWKWLKGATQSDGCVFGDGEGTLTGVSEWYLFCPQGLIRKVNRTAVAALYGVSQSELPGVVEKLVQRYRSTGEKMGRDRRFDKWSFVIGEYNTRLTKPRWGVERQAWELLYPTDRACDLGQANASTARAAKLKSSVQGGARRDVWETIVRFYCHPGPRGSSLREWTITEVRQLCLYEIAVSASVVCEWEQRIERLGVNPIPCVVV